MGLLHIFFSFPCRIEPIMQQVPMMQQVDNTL